MNAGRELDALVEEYVMGRKVDPTRPSWQDGYTFEDTFYSTDISAAWRVVERLRDQWTAATEDMQMVDDFPHPFDDQRFFEVLHRSADRRWPWAFLYVTPEAICLAALRACGYDTSAHEPPTIVPRTDTDNT